MDRRKFMKVTGTGTLVLVAEPALARFELPAGTCKLPLTCQPDPLAQPFSILPKVGWCV